MTKITLFDDWTASRCYTIVCLLALTAVGLIGAVIAASVRHGGSPSIYFLSVGQGDSSLIEFADGVQLLIDGGPSGPALLDALARILPPEDRYIDLVMMTHPQLDHFGGFIDLLKNYTVGAFLGSLRTAALPAYQELHALIEKYQIPYIQLTEGDALLLADARIDMLSPSQSSLMSAELNDTALVALMRSPELSALFTGDIDQKIEERLAAQYDLDVDVLKVAHHGSRFSSSASFLKEVSPLVAAIEVGKNTYGHPTKQALARLIVSGARVVRTDQEGIVKVISEEGVLKIFTKK